MRWLIDSDVLIEGERGNQAFESWSRSTDDEFATADVVRGEYLLGVHAVPETAKRVRGENFYRNRIAAIASFANEAGDFEVAARLAGEARRNGKGKPSLIDALIAAIAIRTGATVATQNLTDFKAMGCACKNPLV
ncbi:MAG TPA: PIN domain-containing protein [Verrucomicrobiae bacterium]|jgi:predicted nucleic acid-binding protein|nr:PIN domain-containing protein [Verrucomicrobiae bacterium]